MGFAMRGGALCPLMSAASYAMYCGFSQAPGCLQPQSEILAASQPRARRRERDKARKVFTHDGVELGRVREVCQVYIELGDARQVAASRFRHGFQVAQYLVDFRLDG